MKKLFVFLMTVFSIVTLTARPAAASATEPSAELVPSAAGETPDWYATHMDLPKQYPFPVLDIVIFGSIAIVIAAVIVLIVVRRRRKMAKTDQDNIKQP